MSAAETPFCEMHSILSAMAAAVDFSSKEAMVDVTPEDRAVCLVLNTTQWLLVELGQAAEQDNLGGRLCELMEELETIRAHVQNGNCPRH